ncbi:hypothetical protein C5167_032988 [Papaver somniferum]|uniref:CREG-like beta-barrel domain-containing protein n=1 Tax=Papaver somniferum TaxID=3469 RepID=A0A4Y7KAF2_PAPSO|nr:hypothetical protein C5167_032988 [Papaver somniferum]
MEKLRISVFCLALVFLGSWIGFAEAGRRGHLVQQKTDPKDAVATARWLVSQNNWGVLSDGLPNKGHGVPYFYLTTLDPTARNGMKDARSSFTVSEFPIGTCGRKDPENPACAKLTLTGKDLFNSSKYLFSAVSDVIPYHTHIRIHFKLVDVNSKEASFAKDALFAKHPEMKGWPKGHDFQIFKLEIEDIFLIDWFGGPKPITVAQYLRPRM